jgi:Domain of unknown function (DUF1707)
MENEKYPRHVFGCGGSRSDFPGRAAAHATEQSGSGDPDLRVSDAERQAAADELKAHFGAGRINMEEFDERLWAALSARTRRDLADGFKDLPRDGSSAVQGQTHRARRPFGALFVVAGLFVAISTFLGTIAFGPVHHFIFPWWIVPIALFVAFRRWRRGWYRAAHASGRRAWLN